MPGFTAAVPDFFQTEGPPDTSGCNYVCDVDEASGVKVFTWGEYVFLGFPDSTNKNEWPFLNNYVIYPVFEPGTFGEGDVLGNEEEKNFGAVVKWIPFTKRDKLLLIDWSYATEGVHVRSELEGLQLWDTRKRLCLMNIITRDYSHSSDNKSSTAREEECRVSVTFNSKGVTVAKNNCNSGPHKGTYKFSGDLLIRSKKWLRR